MELPELPEGDVDTPMGNEAWTREQMRAYALEAIAAERERCARICEDLAERGPGSFKHGTPSDCAAAIRAQGSKA